MIKNNTYNVRSFGYMYYQWQFNNKINNKCANIQHMYMYVLWNSNHFDIIYLYIKKMLEETTRFMYFENEHFSLSFFKLIQQNLYKNEIASINFKFLILNTQRIGLCNDFLYQWFFLMKNLIFLLSITTYKVLHFLIYLTKTNKVNEFVVT